MVPSEPTHLRSTRWPTSPSCSSARTAHSPQSLPAHASLLTGRLPIEHGVRDDAGFSLSADTSTLAELLRNRGFATGGAVSSFLLQERTGIGQGFSFFNDEMPAGASDELAATERPGTQTIDVAERWLSAQNGQRFFAFVQVPERMPTRRSCDCRPR